MRLPPLSAAPEPLPGLLPPYRDVFSLTLKSRASLEWWTEAAVLGMGELVGQGVPMIYPS